MYIGRIRIQYKVSVIIILGSYIWRGLIFGRVLLSEFYSNVCGQVHVNCKSVGVNINKF